MIYSIINTFHNTEINIRLQDDSRRLSAGQTKRVKRELCANGCLCGNQFYRVEDSAGFRFIPVWGQDQFGNDSIELFTVDELYGG